MSGFARGLAACWACVTGLSCSPVAAMSGRAGGLVKDRAEPGRVAAPEASLGRPPGSPVIGPGAGAGVQGAVGLFGSIPIAGFPGAGSAAGSAHPVAWPGLGARGAWGGSASGKAVRRGQSRGARRRVATALSDRRPRLAAGRAGHAARAGGEPTVGWTGSRSACPACRSRAGGGRRRPWRCLACLPRGRAAPAGGGRDAGCRRPPDPQSLSADTLPRGWSAPVSALCRYLPMTCARRATCGLGRPRLR